MSVEEIQEIEKKLQIVKKKYIETLIDSQEAKKKEINEFANANDLSSKKVSIGLDLEKEKIIENRVLLK